MTQQTTTKKQAIHRKDYTPSDFFIDTIYLHFELSPTDTRVKNRMQIRRNPDSSNPHAPLVLNGQQIHLHEVIMNGKKLTEENYLKTDTTLSITKTPEAFELEIETSFNPSTNTSLEGLFISNQIFCTQCEPHGFQRMTYMIDRPDVMSTYTTTIVADAEHYPVLLSNGNCLEEKIRDDGRKQVTWNDPFKKPCYLFALVAGKLNCLEDKFITVSGREITLRIFVEQGQREKTHHAMAMLKEAMRWDEKHYGREYDLDIFMIVAVPDFNMGAMENKGLNIFNAKYILADENTATDKDYEAIATVVAHEYFHNWTGNRITCRDWFQLSLKEGLTVFRDQEFTADITSRPVARIDEVRYLTSTQFPQDAGPLAHPIRPDQYIEMNNFYTVTIYNKGAEIIRMLHALESAEGYRKGMDLYFDRFDGMAVTCDDFVQAHADANKKDYTQFLRWYSQAGTPHLTLTDSFDATTQTYTLHVSQKTHPTADCSPKDHFHIPLHIALFDPISGDKCDEKMLELTQENQDFIFRCEENKPIPSLMRNFSAPVKWTYPYTLDEKIFLLNHDDDAFNQFQMGQDIIYRYFKENNTHLSHDFLEAWKNILTNDHEQEATRARLLNFPTYREFADQQEKIDVKKTISESDAIFRVLAKALADKALAKFLILNDETLGINQFTPELAGKRALKFVCLKWLLEAKHSQAIPLTQTLFDTATNMTDRYHATLLLVQHADESTRDNALAKFLNPDNALIIEKWLQLQASIPHKDTLYRIKTLLQHPAFDIKNPNKVRSLLGVFSQHNFIGFHLSDGSAYEFLAEQILIIDKMNPLLAARLVEPLTQWQHYEDAHAVLLRASLQAIALTPDLSDALSELVNKSLDIS